MAVAIEQDNSRGMTRRHGDQGRGSTRLANDRPARLDSIRRHNLSLVLRRIRDFGPTSRSDLAKTIGLSKATVSSLVEELIALTLLEDGMPESRGRVGRPGSRLRISPAGPVGIGVEVGVDEVSACVANLAGTVHFRTTKRLDNRQHEANEVIALAARLLKQASAKATKQGYLPLGAAVAVPGVVDPNTGTVYRAPNLGWHNVPMLELLARQLPGWKLPLLVDNEANLAAHAELSLGGGRRSDEFVVVSGDVGIGAGIVLGGRVFRGSTGAAGELGHIPVVPSGPACPCGQRGCLERVAGKDAIVAGSGILGVDQGWPDPVAAIVRAATQGDKRTIEALATTGRHLGVGLAMLSNLLALDLVVLTGIFAPLSPWLLTTVQQSLSRAAFAAQWAPMQVVTSTLGDHSPMLGAADFALLPTLSDPETVADHLAGTARVVPAPEPSVLSYW